MDETIKNLYTLFDAAFEENMNGRGTDITRMVTTFVPDAIQNLQAFENTDLTPEEFKESIDFTLELNKKIHKVIKDLKYYLDTNEENGVVYIPKFVIEKIVYNK